MMNLDTGKETIVKRVRQFGSSTSDAVLDPASKIFSVPDIDGEQHLCVRCQAAPRPRL